MRAAAFSRRGFLARAAAGAVGLLGGSFVGGLSTRAWADPLRHLRAGGLPVIDEPKSIVRIGLEEALRREHLASQRPEVRTLVAELIGSGYQRSGRPVGVDGVAGWPTEGGRAVSLGFAEDGSDEATVFVVARWWDSPIREAWPCEDRMPDVYSREVIQGAPGALSVLRFRYVDEQRNLASREEAFDAGSAAGVDCTPDCHPHPPGPCPPSCDGSGPNLCFHCGYWANVCSHPPPDCSACQVCLLCVHFACGASCALACSAVCSTLTEKYCCDYFERVCCPPEIGNLYPPPIPDCL